MSVDNEGAELKPQRPRFVRATLFWGIGSFFLTFCCTVHWMLPAAILCSLIGLTFGVVAWMNASNMDDERTASQRRGKMWIWGISLNLVALVTGFIAVLAELYDLTYYSY